MLKYPLKALIKDVQEVFRKETESILGDYCYLYQHIHFVNQ